MHIPTLNLGILAHVDAGKTSLTERLLFANGAIAQLGSVDAGTTHTDTGDLERERGITIRSAVASFVVKDLQVNLIDTPGHPDFIAEVDRALAVLDAAVLVVSAVEGVQAQTRVLFRSLQRLRVPTLVFVNKIDRPGARPQSVAVDIRRLLTPHAIAIGTAINAGSRDARVEAFSFEHHDIRSHVIERLAEFDDALLRKFVDGWMGSASEVVELLTERVADATVVPIMFGSAITGAGAPQLTAALRALLRRRPATAEISASPTGTVFAIERERTGEKVAYIRLFGGELRERQRVTFHRHDQGALLEVGGTVTRVERIGAAPSDPRQLVGGDVGRIRGIAAIRVGDRLGAAERGPTAQTTDRPRFAPPGLETVVLATDPADEQRLHAVLSDLADEDPLINTRVTADGTTSLLLYGPVQREVIAERLRRDFGIETLLGEIEPVHIERPAGTGEAVHQLDPRADNEFWATIGLRVEPLPTGNGNSFHKRVETGLVPPAFVRAIEEAALRTLRQGVFGWPVTDCSVTLCRVGHHAPTSVAADFRNLTPIVLLRALERATTTVFEPCHALEIELPADTLSGVLVHLVALEGEITHTADHGATWSIIAEIPARNLHRHTIVLPGLTRGEASSFARVGRDRPVRGEPRPRPRTDGNPLNHEEYARHLANRSRRGEI